MEGSTKQNNMKDCFLPWTIIVSVSTLWLIWFLNLPKEIQTVQLKNDKLFIEVYTINGVDKANLSSVRAQRYLLTGTFEEIDDLIFWIEENQPDRNLNEDEVVKFYHELIEDKYYKTYD